MIKRHTYSSIKAIKLGDINRDTKQNFRETEYKKPKGKYVLTALMLIVKKVIVTE